MISGLDHIVVLCPAIEAGEIAYSNLLGREADWRTEDSAGTASVFFQLDNTALEVLAPTGAGPLSRRLRLMLESDGPGLQSLVFKSSNLDDAHRFFTRRALGPDEPQLGESVDAARSASRSWRRFRLNDEVTYGTRIFVLQRNEGDPLSYKQHAPDAAHSLDHVVINTANPERAAALYGARLGLPLALDRSSRDWDARLLFFRTGGTTIEIAHKLSKGVGDQPDKLWGLTWTVQDIGAAHARMEKSGLNVSEIRKGRRPGSKVFTVRDGTLNVPTLILSAEPAS